MLHQPPRAIDSTHAAALRQPRRALGAPAGSGWLALGARISRCAARADTLARALDGVTAALQEGLPGREVRLLAGPPVAADGIALVEVMHAGARLAAIAVESSEAEAELAALLEIASTALEQAAARTAAHELEAARDAAEAASRAKIRFMANMSHDLRTPMNGILGMTELLLGTTLSQQQRRFARAVYGSGELLLKIINDILDSAMIEAGKLELVVADFMPRPIVEDPGAVGDNDSLQMATAGEAAPCLNLEVLVVEDNGVNQEVIVQMLQSLGCRARVASGAMEGLRALCDKRFDLVLMDIQMPGMDGVEALSWFRRGPGSRFNFVTPASTPVVAVTANAFGGVTPFLAVGFDDVLSKPFRRSQLLAVLANRMNQQQKSQPEPAPNEATEPAAAAGEVLDAAALQRLRELDPSGANRLLARVLAAFQTSTDRLLPQLKDAHVAGDLAGVRHVAHTLKSSSASIGALRLSELCAQLETMIRSDKVDALPSCVDAVAAEVEIVLKALQNLMGPKP